MVLLCAACRELGAVCCMLAARLPRSLLLTAQHSTPAYALPCACPACPAPVWPSPALPCLALPLCCLQPAPGA